MEAPRTTESASQTTWTVEKLLAWTRSHFERQKLESPRLCAEILLAAALDCDRVRLYTQHETIPPPPVLDRFRETVRKAATGFPIAYLVGRKEFFSLSFEVTPDVLIPRPETELLVERIITLARKSEGGLPPLADDGVRRIVDVGTGSGCIAIAVAKHLTSARLYASDTSAAALAIARRNAEKCNVAEQITFAEGPLLSPFDEMDAKDDVGNAPPAVPARVAMQFDAILSNPPYIATAPRHTVAKNVLDFEPHAALFAGEDGLAVIRPLIAAAAPRLRPGGVLLLEVAFDQANAVRALLDPTLWADIAAIRDSNRHERIIEARRR